MERTPVCRVIVVKAVKTLKTLLEALARKKNNNNKKNCVKGEYNLGALRKWLFLNSTQNSYAIFTIKKFVRR